MVSKSLKRLWSGSKPLIVLAGLLLTSLYLLGNALHQSARFGEIYSLLLVVNALTVVVLVILIGQHLVRLVRSYRAKEPGSRLTVRLVVILVVVSVTPVSVMYYFAFDFLQRGIDSWFDVRVENALQDALDLSRTSLDIRMRHLLRQTEILSTELIDTPNEFSAIALHDLRRQTDASELTLFTANGRIIASSIRNPVQLVPQRLDSTTERLVREGRNEVGLVPLQDKDLFIRVAVSVASTDPGTEARILQALFPVSDRINVLADGVQAAFSHYRELAYLRKPLKYSFLLTLSLVLFLGVFTAVLAALYSARRLVAPISDLAEGTRAVAEGDYAKRLPVPGKDELGFLVRSFNDMTRRIARAQRQAARSQKDAEEQRTYLEVVLANLSSGVLTLDTELCLQTSNTAASQMLGVPLADYYGKQFINIVDDHTQLHFLIDAITPHLSAEEADWSEEVVLFGAGGRRMFIWRGTSLRAEENAPSGYVIVFDDITALMQAERDAAWGEVARRLAHEIKNPLTPIQLSAERLRHKYLGKMDADDAELLDRSTRTIVQQVENLKEMVKAFSEYARMPRINLSDVDLNQLVQEVIDLYQQQGGGARFKTRLDPSMPHIEADDGRLRQLLHNLFKNALEAVDYQPEVPVEVSTRCMEESTCHFVELRVRDSGPGIPDDMLGSLFEPYVTTKPKGTGLGLAIVKKIVEEHGGMLWAENNKKGGACLVIRLPVLRPEETGQDATGMELDDNKHNAA